MNFTQKMMKETGHETKTVEIDLSLLCHLVDYPNTVNKEHLFEQLLKQIKNEQALTPYYDSHVKYYSPMSEHNVQRIVSLLDVPLTGRFLDIGCGTGWWCNWLRDKGVQAYGIDYSYRRIQANFKAYLMTYSWQEYLDKIPITNFNYVTLWDVLEHLEDPESLIKRLTGHVKIYASIPLESKGLTHIQVFTFEEIQKRLAPDYCVGARIDAADYALCRWDK